MNIGENIIHDTQVYISTLLSVLNVDYEDYSFTNADDSSKFFYVIGSILNPCNLHTTSMVSIYQTYNQHILIPDTIFDGNVKQLYWEFMNYVKQNDSSIHSYNINIHKRLLDSLVFTFQNTDECMNSLYFNISNFILAYQSQMIALALPNEEPLLNYGYKWTSYTSRISSESEKS